ncbi:MULTISPECIES: response regulator transcription factor [unclassified Luteococcus]|uniref:response regulator transcription factor n=1 Tax=unclassified Luteococcus TaxID=2639923 RepID=UPI00313C562D
MNPPAHGILLADDHALVRRGVRLILEQHDDLRVVAEAGDGAEAIQAALDPSVELAVLDVAMPRMTGLQAAREISRRRPELPMLILSMHDNEQYFFESLAVGAAGYVLKSVADRDLVDACRAALAGRSYLYPGVESRLLRDYLDRLDRGEAVKPALLTPREDQVVKLIAEGHSSAEIADLLVISIKTVERHRENVLAKLGMRDRTELTRYAIRVGLVEP